MSRGRGFAPGVFGRLDLAALAQPHLELCLSICLIVLRHIIKWAALVMNRESFGAAGL
jgi:hypothetical protein